MSVIKAICPKCDYSYYDWGLYNPIEYYCKDAAATWKEVKIIWRTEYMIFQLRLSNTI